MSVRRWSFLPGGGPLPQARRQAGEEASPDPGDSPDPSTVVSMSSRSWSGSSNGEDSTVIVSPDRDLANDGQAVGVGVERFADQIVDDAAVVLGRVDVIDSRGDRGLEHADSRCPVRWRSKGVRAAELHRTAPRPPDQHLAPSSNVDTRARSGRCWALVAPTRCLYHRRVLNGFLPQDGHHPTGLRIAGYGASSTRRPRISLGCCFAQRR
jgi:hypothetical protein